MRGFNLPAMQSASARAATASLMLAALAVACGARTGFDLPVVEVLGADGGVSLAGGDGAADADESQQDGGEELGDAAPDTGPDASPDATGCGPENCAGCCSGGQCKSGFAPEACGGGGGACVLCGPELACDAFTHQCT